MAFLACVWPGYGPSDLFIRAFSMATFCGSSSLNDLNKEFLVTSGRVLFDYFYKLKLSIVFDKKVEV